MVVLIPLKLRLHALPCRKHTMKHRHIRDELLIGLAYACHAQGLGFPQLSNMRTLPVFFNMIVSGLMDAPTFAVYLNPNPSAEPAGEVQFGGMNSARFTGTMNWTPSCRSRESSSCSSITGHLVCSSCTNMALTAPQYPVHQQGSLHAAAVGCMLTGSQIWPMPVLCMKVNLLPLPGAVCPLPSSWLGQQLLTNTYWLWLCTAAPLCCLLCSLRVRHRAGV